MADVRITFEAVDEETGQPQLVSIFVSGDADLVPVQEGGPKTMAGQTFGPLHEIALLVNKQTVTWQAVHVPVVEEYKPEPEEGEDPD